MKQGAKAIVWVYYNNESFYFEHCKVVEVLDRIIISNKTTGEVIGSFPINTTAWHTPQH